MIIALGAFMGALSVIFGAFGAHAIREHVTPELMQVYTTGTQYFQMHSLAVLAYGLWHQTIQKPGLKAWPAYSFAAGTAVFTGSLYLLSLTGIRALGAITPIGGLLLIASWIGFGVQAYRNRRI